jgi:hypothetical protein
VGHLGAADRQPLIIGGDLGVGEVGRPAKLGVLIGLDVVGLADVGGGDVVDGVEDEAQRVLQERGGVRHIPGQTTYRPIRPWAWSWANTTSVTT